MLLDTKIIYNESYLRLVIKWLFVRLFLALSQKFPVKLGWVA